MSEKKSPIRYLIAALVGVAAVAGSIVGLSKLLPKMKEECCKGMGEECCGGHGAVKPGDKKHKK